MSRTGLLLRTKLSPPRLHRRVLPRPALTAHLREALDYRLTLIQASTGYGKSTALAALAQEGIPLYWYSIGETDADPSLFLAYLIEAFRVRLPGLSDKPAALLQEFHEGGGGEAWTQALDALINALAEAIQEPSLLVVDDFHFVAGAPEVRGLAERFVSHLPADLHVIAATRYPLNGPPLVAWRAKGEVLEIGRETLAFQPDEIEALFGNAYGMQLSPAEVAALAHKTEGWPIALQLVWQGLRHRSARNALDLLERGPALSLNSLFEFLARDVLARQPAEVASFLLHTSVLRELSPAACGAVTGADPEACAAMLTRLHDLDLFVFALEHGREAGHESREASPEAGSSAKEPPAERLYRYHHLFHDFLRAQSEADLRGTRERHRRAAEYFQAHGDVGEAIYRWLDAHAFAEAATAIGNIGDAVLRDGRLDTLAHWIDALPAEVVTEHPSLQAMLGDLSRLRSRFDEALNWYAAAEHLWRSRGDEAGLTRALRGQALVYLDTVRPVDAEKLLEEALRVADGTPDRAARARLLELLAENKLNMGKPDEAEALRVQAHALREEGPTEDVLSVRVKLRTGRLDEAQRVLEGWVEAERREAERGEAHAPRSHRESVLILSLVHAFRGEAERAFALAQEGVTLGERLDSPFVTAVGHLRLGHAWQLRGDVDPRQRADEAIRCYRTSIQLGDRLAVRRTRLEAMWGLTRAYGYSGDLASAQGAAAEGIEIGRWAGDPWVGALVELSLGASFVLAGRHEDGQEVLARALSSFRACGDRLGRAASRLWMSLASFELKQFERFLPSAENLLTLCETHDYGFLFTAPTLLGPPDPHRLVPLLVEARSRQVRPALAARLLGAMGLPEIRVHPGYQLRIQTLGAFRAWRGSVEIEPREWRRDKARQLFHLLLTQRGRPLQREEIVERLWPELTPEAANRDFKVALNALNRVLEPAREPESPSAFVAREGAAYSVRPEADLWLDTLEFERECEAGLRLIESRSEPPGEAALDRAILHLQAAQRLYGGDYLPEATYEDWASDERERLRTLFLRAAARLAAALIERGRYDEGLEVCQAILARDECWEQAYRLMMVAFARQGNRPQAFRIYQRCESVLREELNVSPSPATVALHQRIALAGDGPVDLHG